MVKDGRITDDDIRDIDLNRLLQCPFCEILGQETVLKVPLKRKVSRAVPEEQSASRAVPEEQSAVKLPTEKSAVRRRKTKAVASCESANAATGDENEVDDPDYLPEYVLSSESEGTGSELEGSEDESKESDDDLTYGEPYAAEEN